MTEELTTHLLNVPAGVAGEEVRRLLGEHFPAAVSRTSPSASASSQSPALPLSYHTAVHGPQSGPGGTTDWRFVTTRRRGEPPDPGVPDPDGVYWLFADGLPEDEELRVMEVLLGLARQLHGRVVVDAADGDGGRQIEPDPDIRIDLTVWSRHLVSAAQVTGLLHDVEPDAHVPPADTSFLGAMPRRDSMPEGTGRAELTDAERSAIHRAALRVDSAALGSDDIDPHRFAVLIPLTSPGDLIAIEAHPADDVHLALADLPSSVARHFCSTGGLTGAAELAIPDHLMCYDVRWQPGDDEALMTDEPGVALLARRAQAQHRIRVVAAAITPALEALVTNADGYLIDPRER